MRNAIALLALVAPAALANDYIDTDYFETDYFETDYFNTDGGLVEVPNVVGETDFTAADVILEAAGLDTGLVMERCSSAADDEVIAQDPSAGEFVEPASTVDLLVSNGVECSGRGQIATGLGLGFGL